MTHPWQHTDRPQSMGEEIANSVSHGVGFVLALVALPVLVVNAMPRGAAAVVGASVFAGTLALLYLTSTLYHALTNPRAKRVFRTLDHSAIYLLIAGSYTPFTLGVLRGPWGWSLFGIVWGLAVIGIATQPILIRQRRWMTAVPYVLMGWVVVIGIKPLLETVAPGGLALLVSGGLAYTLGAIVYASKRIPFNHAIWHGFVLAGSICHFFAVLFYVIPLA